jgi:hypothetical protein
MTNRYGRRGTPGLLRRGLCDAGMELPLVHSLRAAGVNTIGDLRHAVNSGSLLEIRGIGPSTLRRVGRQLEVALSRGRIAVYPPLPAMDDA